jgi:hypothetical protein
MITPGTDDRIEVVGGVDTDLDGHPDTLLLPDHPELLLAVDLDRDTLADVVLEVGPDAVVRRFPLTPGSTDPLADACYPDDLDDAPDAW